MKKDHVKFSAIAAQARLEEKQDGQLKNVRFGKKLDIYLNKLTKIQFVSLL
jgi:hypothetical protein